MIDILTYV